MQDIDNTELCMLRDFILAILQINSSCAEIELENIVVHAIKGGYKVREEWKLFAEAQGRFALGDFAQNYSE